MIICLEGIDACGKATQAKRMAETMEAKLISFPDYSSLTGRLIARILQDGFIEPEPQDRAVILQSLMTTNRMEHAPFLSQATHLYGEDIVLDRYWPSGVVYGGADGLDVEWLLKIHETLPQAHHYILLDIDPGESITRRPERRDLYEQREGLMQEAAVRYRQLWERMDDLHYSSWHVVDGMGTEDEVENRIWSCLTSVT